MKWVERASHLGSVVSSLLACAACPLCLPIYAALLSAIGVELGALNAYFFPLMVVFFGFTLVFMYRQSQANHTPKTPFFLGLSAALITAYAAYNGYEWILYGSLALFVSSSFWNKHLISKNSHQKCCKS